ncbi:hypothetical protein V8C42DRAFT_54294 [Trichoderma barbatum]
MPDASRGFALGSAWGLVGLVLVACVRAKPARIQSGVAFSPAYSLSPWTALKLNTKVNFNLNVQTPQRSNASVSDRRSYERGLRVGALCIRDWIRSSLLCLIWNQAEVRLSLPYVCISID